MEPKGGGLSRWKTAFAFALAAVAIVLLYWLRTDLLLVFLALLLAIVFDGIAGLGVRFLRLPRTVAVVVAAVLFLAITAGGVALVVVPILRQGTQFVQALPKMVAKFDRTVASWRQDFPWLDRFWPENPPPASGDQASKTPQMAKKALVTLSATMEGAATALAVFFLGLFLAWDPDRWLRGVAGLWPEGSADERVRLFKRIGAGLRSYLLTLGLYIVIMGVAWTVGLWLIGIKYAFLFGAIGGLVEIVPYVGPFLGLLPPLLISLSAGPAKAGLVVLLYVILHIVEGYVLVPYLMQRGTHLPPPVIILSILFCGTIFGTLGVALAVPIGTAIYVWLNERVYRRQTP